MPIQRRAAFAVVAAALTAFGGPAFALDYKIAPPILHDNLAVYLVEGGAAGQPALLTVEQAAQRGLVRIHRGENSSVTMDNMSGQSLLVPFGTLLGGGLQDQVVGTATILPPNAHNVPLNTFCVDPFRSSPRSSASADAFALSGTLIPSRTAKLSMWLNSAADTKAVDRLRQSGVWWSIDTLRSHLEKQLGVRLEPPTSVKWNPNLSTENRATTVLAGRASKWTTGLPLALTNRRLRTSVAPYMSTAAIAVHSDGNVIGAVFAINGQLAGAELYGSPELFRQMWPQLLRAYATEAIALQGVANEQLPSIAAVKHFLFEAPAAEAHYDWTNSNYTQIRERENVVYYTHIREAQNVVYSEMADERGHRIQASYLSKALPDRGAFTPDELVVDALAKRTLNGRTIASLSDSDSIDFRRSAGGTWTATIPQSTFDTAIKYAYSLAGVILLLLICKICGQLLPLSLRAAVFQSGTLSKLGAATVRFTQSAALGALIAASGWMHRASAAARIILNRPLIPSPLAVLRMCVGIKRPQGLVQFPRFRSPRSRLNR
jgi:hypothetical protein